MNFAEFQNVFISTLSCVPAAKKFSCAHITAIARWNFHVEFFSQRTLTVGVGIITLMGQQIKFVCEDET